VYLVAHVFAYGTLMFPEVWQAVVGSSYAAVAGAAAGFQIFRVRDAVFPGIIAASAAHTVRGLVYLDVDANAIERLDRFEDSFYQRRSIAISGDDGRRFEAEAYVVPVGLRTVLTDEPCRATNSSPAETSSVSSTALRALVGCEPYSLFFQAERRYAHVAVTRLHQQHGKFRSLSAIRANRRRSHHVKRRRQRVRLGCRRSNYRRWMDALNRPTSPWVEQMAVSTPLVFKKLRPRTACADRLVDENDLRQPLARPQRVWHANRPSRPATARKTPAR
jgi:gamma-glutamylcyclotransferase (GGCT)/AIG2-like uncharacterized protein YtfP